MSNADMTTAMSALGGQIMCSSSRETIMYQSSHSHNATPLALSLISETVQNASLLPEELKAQRAAAEYEIRELGAKPELILPEILHHIAYDGKGLGNPLLCPEDRIHLIGASLVRHFMRQMYRPERMVIAGAGVAHEELVELADKHFSSLKYAPVVDGLASTVSLPHTSPSVPPNLLHSQPPNAFKLLTRAASSYLYPNSPAPALGTGSAYTGGYRFIHDPQSEFNHIYISFEGVGIHDDDIYELATMQVLLGGGGSFSAGTHQTYLHIIDLLIPACRWSWQGYVLKAVYLHPEPSRGNRSLCILPPYI
jgi:mitochondrial-processing peptidase subunit alpha